MSRARLEGLLLNEYTYLNLLDERVTVPTQGAYGEACSGLDRGDPVSILDVISVEQDLSLLDDDEAVKAAATLAMCGWRPEQLGGLFHPKLAGGRPGRRLLRDAVSMLVARRRQALYAEKARVKALDA